MMQADEFNLVRLANDVCFICSNFSSSNDDAFDIVRKEELLESDHVRLYAGLFILNVRTRKWLIVKVDPIMHHRRDGYRSSKSRWWCPSHQRITKDWPSGKCAYTSIKDANSKYIGGGTVKVSVSHCSKNMSVDWPLLIPAGISIAVVL